LFSFIIDFLNFFSHKVIMLLFFSDMLNRSLDFSTELRDKVVSIVNMVFDLHHGDSIVQAIEVFHKWVCVVDIWYSGESGGLLLRGGSAFS